MGSEVRVDELRSRVNAHGLGRTDALAVRERVDRELLPRLLELMAVEVRERLGPEAVVHVRYLRSELRLTAARLDDAELLRELALELSRYVIAEAVAARTRRPSPEADVVAFADEVEQLVQAQVDRAHGRPRAWFHAAVPEAASPWKSLLRRGVSVMRRVLDRLVEQDEVGRVLGYVGESGIDAASGVLPLERWPAEARKAAERTRGAAAGDGSLDAATDPLDVSVAGAGERPEPVRRPAGDATGAAEGHGTEPGAPSSDRLWPRPASGRTPEAIRAAASHPRAEPTEMSSPAPTASDPAPRADASGAVRSQELLGRGVETAFAGVFYLLGPVLELELAKHLWRAGQREGEVLAEAAAALLGESLLGDAAYYALGGLPTGTRYPLDPVEAWALDELRAAIPDGLQSALERRGFTADLRGPMIAASEALALRVSHADDATRELVGCCAAVLLVFVQTCLGEPPDPEPLRGRLTVGGRLALGDDELTVHLPMDAVDLAVRRAGFDQDPGWIPWLERHVRFVFEGGETW